MYFLFHSSFYLLQTLPLSSCCLLCNNSLVNKENRPWRSGGKRGFREMICVQCNLFMTENTLFVNLMTQNTIFDICGDGWKTYGYKLSLRVVSFTALLFWRIYRQYSFIFIGGSKISFFEVLMCIIINVIINVAIIIIIIIIITRPKPAYGRQGLAGGSLRASGAQLGSGKWWFFVTHRQTNTSS